MFEIDVILAVNELAVIFLSFGSSFYSTLKPKFFKDQQLSCQNVNAEQS